MSIIDEAFEALVKQRVDYAIVGYEERSAALEKENGELKYALIAFLKRIGGSVHQKEVFEIAKAIDERVTDIQRLLQDIEADQMVVLPPGTRVRTPSGGGVVVETCVKVNVQDDSLRRGTWFAPRHVVPDIPDPTKP